jgi:hypothetical protein
MIYLIILIKIFIQVIFIWQKILKHFFIIILLLLYYYLCSGQQVGEVTFVGDTYYDLQHAGSNDRMIALDLTNGLHFVWTGGINPPQVKYNYRNPDGSLNWQYGINVSELNSSCYATLGVITDRRAVISYEGVVAGDNLSAVSVDQSGGTGSFLEFYIPNVDTTLWQPRIAVDMRDWIHIIAYSARVNLKRALYYNRSANGGLTWLNNWVFIDSVRVFSAGIASSTDGKVAIAWSHPINPVMTSPLEMLDNDIYFVESISGSTWDFANPINLTDFVNGVHPEADSLRAYDDISLLYDNIYHLHFAYTCAGFWQGPIHAMTCAGSKIYHYCDLTGFNYIAGVLSEGKFPADDRRMYDRPSLGYDAYNTDLYCIWNQFSDQVDTSATGYPNGEIYGAYAEMPGEIWSSAVNLTNTHSPGAAPGENSSENFPSLAAMVNDTLHIEYLLDREPGYFNVFISDIKYQKISTTEFKNLVQVQPYEVNSPVSIYLLTNSPNPFNECTKITIVLKRDSGVDLTVFDINGRIVERLYCGVLSSGRYDFNFKASNLTSGIYLARLSGGNFTLSKKMLLLK